VNVNDPKTSEKATQNEILAAFGALPFLRLWRQNTGAAKMRDGSYVAFGLVGSADLSGILRCGRRVEIEVKSATGRVRPEQERFANMIRAFGGFYVLARERLDVKTAIDEHLLSCGTCAGAGVYTPPRF
jgi:hypothetical protein